MAYVNKELKEKVVSAVKEVLPKDWKVTFAVHHHMTIACKIRKAPVDLKAAFDCDDDNFAVNQYHVDSHCKDKEVAKIINDIIKALNCDNYNNSDPMTDYFDVGYYIDLQFGSWDKPFINTK